MSPVRRYVSARHTFVIAATFALCSVLCGVLAAIGFPNTAIGLQGAAGVLAVYAERSHA